jgi:hypothetical protein
LLLAVADTGAGMAEVDASLAFEEYAVDSAVEEEEEDDDDVDDEANSRQANAG